MLFRLEQLRHLYFGGGSQRANTLSEEENERKMEKLKYLASEAGKFVTCHDLVVDGGRSVAYNEPQHKEGQ